MTCYEESDNFEHVMSITLRGGRYHDIGRIVAHLRDKGYKVEEHPQSAGIDAYREI